MQIRQATRDDLDRLFELWREMQYAHIAYHPAYYPLVDPATAEERVKTRFRALIPDAEYCFLVAVEEDQVIGQCLATTQVKLPVYEPVVQLEVLHAVVDPAHRRKGVFRQLLDAATAWGIERGAAEVELVVDSLNPAVDAYKACNFEIVHYKMVRQIDSDRTS